MEDCFEEMTYSPLESQIDFGLTGTGWYLPYTKDNANTRGPGKSTTARYILPETYKGQAFPAGHAIILIQWTTSHQSNPKKVAELKTTNPGLYAMLTHKNGFRESADEKCEAKTDREKGQCAADWAAFTGSKTLQDQGDWLGQQFRQLVDIEISGDANDDACHAPNPEQRPFDFVCPLLDYIGAVHPKCPDVKARLAPAADEAADETSVAE